KGVDEVLEDPDRVLLEAGPGSALGSLVCQSPKAGAARAVLSSLGRPGDGLSDSWHLADALGRLWLAGVEIDWRAYHDGEARSRVVLPTYPFERQRYWIEAVPDAAASGAGRAGPERKPDIADWFYLPSWKRSAPCEALPGAGEG